MTDISTFKPDRTRSGQSLVQASVTGERVNFVQDSTYAEAVLTLAVAGDSNNFDFAYFDTTFDFTVDGNTYPWESIIAWQYANFFVDEASPALDNQYRVGSEVSGSGTTLRKSMLIDIFGHHLYTPFTLNNQADSHANIWYAQNHDSSTHLVLIQTIWKFIVIGGQNGQT